MEMQSADPAADVASSERAERLLRLVTDLARELHPGHVPAAVTMQSSLERDLLFDSLGRVELMMRLEKAFGVRLPDRAFAQADTPASLVREVDAAAGLPAAGALPDVLLEAPTGGASAPRSVATLVSALRWHAESHPERTHITLFEEETATAISYGDLLRAAESVAAGLQERGIVAGDRVALMLPTCRGYYTAFAGALCAGAVPVPLYPPARPSQLEDHLRRQARILSSCQARLLVTVPEAAPAGLWLKTQVPTLEAVVTPEDLETGGKPWPVPVAPTDLAFLQYTSGSTADPKGVMLTHANLLANIRAMGTAAGVTSDDVFVSWLPLYHDMGLIGSWLGSLVYAMPFVSMSPLAFLARPSRWLLAIHRARGALSAAPNFAYELCAARCPDEEIDGIDLSSWRLAFNGAEPVSPATLDRFHGRFGRYGLRREALTPVYGLAENCLGVTFPPLERGPVTLAVDREALSRTGVAREPADGAAALALVACGRPLPGHEVRIVDDAGRELPERREGRIQFSGPSATAGYWGNPAATAALVEGSWRNTGDRGFVADGDLFVTGRVKDVIIRGGRNLHPQELEQAAGEVPGVRKGCVAVLGLPDAAGGTERLVVVAERKAGDAVPEAELVGRIQDLAIELTGAPADQVLLVAPGTIPKTSSGKLRRAALTEVVRGGRVGATGGSVRRQVARLFLSGIAAGARRQGRRAFELGRGALTWGIVIAGFAALWIAVAVLPGLRVRQRLAALAARSLLGLLRIRAARTGKAPPERGPCVLVANHASYLDPVVLLAVLPPGVRFVAKRELAGSIFWRVFLGRLGTLFAERFEAGQGVADTEAMIAALRDGAVIAMFPEGTFHRMPGLLPFRPGAFVTAAAAGAPVVPVALRGMRSVLRATRWIPSPGTVRVEVGAAIYPEGIDFRAAMALRDRAREEVLACCGEPDLGDRPDLTPLAATAERFGVASSS